MTLNPLCLSPELESVDPVLYNHLDRLDLQADTHQGQQISDHCLDAPDFETLKGLGVVTEAHLDIYQRQFRYFENTWNSQSSEARSAWMTGLKLARNGMERQASGIFNHALKMLAGRSEAQHLFRRELVWLNFYFGHWQDVDDELSSLRAVYPEDPHVLFMSAELASRRRRYREAFSFLDRLQNSKNVPPYLLEESHRLEEEVAAKDRMANNQPVHHASPFSLIEQKSYFSHTAAQIRALIPRVRELLAMVDPKNFNVVANRLLDLHRTGKITSEQLPLLAQAYFHAFHRYEVFNAPRSVGSAVASGTFDCNELAEGVQEILRRAGIETKGVVFSDTQRTKHAFTAFRINGKWGYVSASSFKKPEFASLGDVLQLWESQRFTGAYLVGKFQQGRLTEVTIHPPPKT